MDLIHVLGGGLNPILGFCFPLFSRCCPTEFPSGWKFVESSRSKSLVFFGQSTYIFYVRFNHFWAVKIRLKRVFNAGHGYLRRVRDRVAVRLGKRWHAARKIDALRRPWYRFTPRALGAGLATLDYGCAVRIGRNDLPKHRFGIPDLHLSEDLCAEPLAGPWADSLTAHDLLSCGQKWLACLTPFFKESERKSCGCQHRLFFSQVEYCDNFIFHRRAALDQLGNRLLDANRLIGQPNKITTIFGRKVTKYYKGKLQTVIEDIHLPNPVIRTHYGNGFLKQYVRDHLCLRTELATNDVTDYGVKKAVENLPPLRDRLSAICDNYLSVQQDILESFVDRGQLHHLTQPTILPNGKRIPRAQTRRSTTTGSDARPGMLRSHCCRQHLYHRRTLSLRLGRSPNV